jgi:hypothetical protein
MIGRTSQVEGQDPTSMEMVEGGDEEEGKEDDRDTEDELYQVEAADVGDPGLRSSAVDVAVQTRTSGDEGETAETSPQQQRKVKKEHAAFSESALREFTRRSRALISSVQVMMR